MSIPGRQQRQQPSFRIKLFLCPKRVSQRQSFDCDVLCDGSTVTATGKVDLCAATRTQERAICTRRSTRTRARCRTLIQSDIIVYDFARFSHHSRALLAQHNTLHILQSGMPRLAQRSLRSVFPPARVCVCVPSCTRLLPVGLSRILDFIACHHHMTLHRCTPIKSLASHKTHRRRRRLQEDEV